MNLLSQRLPILAESVQFIQISEVAQEPTFLAKYGSLCIHEFSACYYMVMYW